MPAEVIIEQSPRSGADNMRIDESMLQSVVDGHGKTLVRIYRWKVPTISLGHFQKNVRLPARFAECPVVNRLTGGGAILHDQELTYSIALSADHALRHDPTEAYVRVHTAIIGLLGEFGIVSKMRGTDHASESGAEPGEQLLCFLRHDPRDVVIGTDKIIGSAQRRRKGNILQHGSVLMRASDHVPEIPGIVDLSPNFPEDEFERRLPDAVSRVL